MEDKKEIFGMLDLMLRPGFCVKEHRIVRCNPAGEALLFIPGTDVRTILAVGQEEYESFQGGCLYLKLLQNGSEYGAAVTRVDDWEIFSLDAPQENAQLQALALASRELRSVLSSVMIAADQILPSEGAASEPQARLVRGLNQLLRLVGNMSDAGRGSALSHQELTEFTWFFSEIMEKAKVLFSQAQITLEYQFPQQEIYTMVDRDLMERAILNLLSNAAKFTPAHGTVTVTLAKPGKLLRLSVQDGGPGIDPKLSANLFSRYLRSPGIEDSRQGLGLGLVLVRSAALSHGGTLLADNPSGARFTMTLAIREPPQKTLRSPVLRPDYAGGWDHGLLELSDCLPTQCYQER